MKIFSYKEIDKENAVRFFKNVFTESCNVEEGTMVSGLVDEIISSTRASDLFGFVVLDGEQLLGCIFFSRITFEQSLDAFILSPVAVDTQSQGTGIGQKLITHGLDQLKARGVRLVFTYGDPNYYSKVGFQHIEESVIKAPHPLSQPEGWLCQAMDETEIPNIVDKPKCVQAFDNPKYW